MEGSNGGRGSSWSYHHEIGSNVSSSSGTIVSSLSSGSRLSTSSTEAEVAMYFDSLEASGWEAAEEDPMNLIKSLVLEFFSASSANCSIKGVDMSAVERWLKKLGGDWLFNVEDGASAGEEYDRDVRIRTWIRALDQLTLRFCLAKPLFPDRSVELPGIYEEEGEPVAENFVPDRYHLAQFVQETMLKILSFVDVLVAWDPDTIEYFAMDDQVMSTKLANMLLVHDALSQASEHIVTPFDSPTSVEVERIENEIAILLSAYKSKASEVIRSTMEKIRIVSMEDGDDSPSPVDPQGSSDIHKVTLSVLTCIDFLINTNRLVKHVMQGHVPYTKNIRPVDNMVVEMVSSLQEKLVNISESFSDQGLKLLFLLNNSRKIQWRLRLYEIGRPKYVDLPDPVSLQSIDVANKIKGYMERYLQVSWAPLLSCLCNSTPLCLGKNYSLLSKFESEIQKICTTQMEWKVPDPWLRRQLRQAISDKIIPGYTEYIEDKKVSHPKISPQDLKAKLQELFEGC